MAFGLAIRSPRLRVGIEIYLAGMTGQAVRTGGYVIGAR
jgi:hypothetical protein